MHLQPTDRLAHTEWAHRYLPLIEKVAGRPVRIPDDWLSDNEDYWGAVAAFYDAEELGLVFPAPCQQGPVPWKRLGRVTDMGHGAYAPRGADVRHAATCPFTDVEQVYAFDAVREYGRFDVQTLARYLEKRWQQMQRIFPGQLVLGGYYFTLMSGMIQAFGWDMLLEALADPDRMRPVVDSFARLTMTVMRAWAQTSAPVIAQHDDIVWGTGPFMRPDLYRELLFDHLRRFWAVLHAAGKKVMYVSDGDYSAFFDEIAAAGADGFFLEPSCPNLEQLIDGYGRTHFIVGSFVDCRALSFESWSEVREQMDRTFAAADRCRGLIWAVGNQIPYDLPVDRFRRYIDYFNAGARR